MDQGDGCQSMFNPLLRRDTHDAHAMHAEANGSEVDEENMDFYGESEAQAGVRTYTIFDA